MHKKGHARGKENRNLWQEIWTLSVQDLILLSLTCVNRSKSLVIRRISLVRGKGEEIGLLTLVSHQGGKGAKERESSQGTDHGAEFQERQCSLTGKTLACDSAVPALPQPLECAWAISMHIHFPLPWKRSWGPGAPGSILELVFPCLAPRGLWLSQNLPSQAKLPRVEIVQTHADLSSGSSSPGSKIEKVKSLLGILSGTLTQTFPEDKRGEKGSCRGESCIF